MIKNNVKCIQYEIVTPGAPKGVGRARNNAKLYNIKAIIAVDDNSYLIATILDAVVVGLTAVVRTVAEPLRTVVQGRVSHEAMGQGFVTFLVPLQKNEFINVRFSLQDTI